MRCTVSVLLIAALVACSSSGGSTPVSPTPTTPTTATAPAGPPTISITAAGMSPLELTIAVGQRVTFINNDTRAHDVVGGVDPNRPECPEIAMAGFLTPGQRGETGVFTAARTCEYHDHTALGVPAFQGRIFIR